MVHLAGGVPLHKNTCGWVHLDGHTCYTTNIVDIFLQFLLRTLWKSNGVKKQDQPQADDALLWSTLKFSDVMCFSRRWTHSHPHTLIFFSFFPINMFLSYSEHSFFIFNFSCFRTTKQTKKWFIYCHAVLVPWLEYFLVSLVWLTFYDSFIWGSAKVKFVSMVKLSLWLVQTQALDCAQLLILLNEVQPLSWHAVIWGKVKKLWRKLRRKALQKIFYWCI